MGHHIYGFVAGAETLEAFCDRARVKPPTKLGQDLSYLPLTAAFFDAIHVNGEGASSPTDVFGYMTERLREIMLTIAGKIAYIETDYFGGAGFQAAMLVADGKVAVPPRKAKIGPINEVLRAMGVRKWKDADEFATVGLGQIRNHEAWEEAE